MVSKTKLVIYVLLLLVILTSCNMLPAQAPSVNFTDTLKPTVTAASTATITPFPTETLMPAIVVFDESTSPDGTWTAMVILTIQGIQGENKDLLFRVFNNTTGQEWIIEQIDVDKVEEPPPGGFFYPYIFKWSQDNNYLYYSYLSTGGDGCFRYFKPGGFGLKSFDLSIGSVVEIRSDSATWMALSPDEKKLAYIEDWGPDVTILELDGKTETTFRLPEIQNDVGMETETSYILWSPNGDALIYAHLLGVCDYKVWYSYIISINPDTQQQVVLVDHGDQGYVPVYWNETNGILLKDKDEATWWLNLTTKEITPESQ